MATAKTKQKILKTFLDLLSEHPYEDVSLPLLAETAKVKAQLCRLKRNRRMLGDQSPGSRQGDLGLIGSALVAQGPSSAQPGQTGLSVAVDGGIERNQRVE